MVSLHLSECSLHNHTLPLLGESFSGTQQAVALQLLVANKQGQDKECSLFSVSSKSFAQLHATGKQAIEYVYVAHLL